MHHVHLVTDEGGAAFVKQKNQANLKVQNKQGIIQADNSLRLILIGQTRWLYDLEFFARRPTTNQLNHPPINRMIAAWNTSIQLSP